MKTKFKIILMALVLAAVTTVTSCSDDDIDDGVCEGLTQDECDRLL